MQHPDISSIESYARRELPPAGMLKLGDHIAVCDACRGLLRAISLRGAPGRELQSILGEDPALHLSTQEIEAAAGSPQALSADAKSHLAACADCRAEVAELRRFYSPVAVMKPRPVATPRSSGLPRWTAWAGLAAAAAIVLAIQLPRMRHASSPTPGVMVAELRDGNTALGLDARGVLSGAPALPAEYTALLAGSLQNGRLPASGISAPLSPEEGLRAENTESGEKPQFDVVYPRNEITTTQPTFRWNALPGAKMYQVELYDAHFNLVEKSPKLTQLTWAPSTPLQANAKYRWAVNALTAAGVTQAPGLSFGEARFTVADGATLNSIEVAAKQFPGSHLLLANLYAKAGMRTQARMEVDALAARNPGSALVQELARSLDAQSSPSSAKPAQ